MKPEDEIKLNVWNIFQNQVYVRGNLADFVHPAQGARLRFAAQVEPLLNTFFFCQAEDGIRAPLVTGVQTCALPISGTRHRSGPRPPPRGPARPPRRSP